MSRWTLVAGGLAAFGFAALWSLSEFREARSEFEFRRRRPPGDDSRGKCARSHFVEILSFRV